MYDVIVVGGGTAGVATAYFLRDLKLDICVLEATGEVGGRSNTVDLAGASANSGALFIYRNTRTEELATELALDVVPFEPATYGIHVNGKTIVAETNEDLVARLDLTDSEKAELSEFFDSALLEYNEHTSNGVLDQDDQGLATETIATGSADCNPAYVRSSTPLCAAGLSETRPSCRRSTPSATSRATSRERSATDPSRSAACRPSPGRCTATCLRTPFGSTPWSPVSPSRTSRTLTR